MSFTSGSNSLGSIPENFQRALGNAAGFVSSLSKLAVAEMSEGIGSVAKGAGAIVTGLFIALIGLLFLLHAAVALLVLYGFNEAASYAIVGGVAIVLGVVALFIGAKLCTSASPVPRRTLREVRALFSSKEIAP